MTAFIPRMRLTALLVLVPALCSCGQGELRVIDNETGERSPGIVGPGNEGTSNGTGLTVFEPAANALLTSELVTVKGTVKDASMVVANGKEVEVKDGTFEVTVVIPEGEQTIVVDAMDHVPVFVPIRVDARPPVVTLSSPNRGAFLVKGQTDLIDVKGVATDRVTSVAEVSVNGQIVPVAPDGSFSAQVSPVEGGSILVVEAKDAAGHTGNTTRGVIYGDFAPWTDRVKDGIDMRMQAASMPIMEKSFADALLLSMSQDFATGGGGEVEVKGVSIESVDVDLVPRQGYFDATITIWDMRIDAEVEQEILFITTDVDATITMDRAVVQTQLYITTNPQGGLSTRLEGSDVRLHGFELDLDGIFELVEGFAEDYVEESTLELFEQAVTGGQQSDDGPSILPVDLLGQEEELILYFSRFDIDPGGFGFAGDLAMDVAQGPGVPASPGFFVTSGGAPPTDGFTQMVRFSMADDLINYMLAQIWRSGALNSTDGTGIGEGEEALTAGTFALLVGPAIRDFAEEDTPVVVRTTALLPPVGRFTPDAEHDMEVVMADMMIEFALAPPGEQPKPFATVATSFVVHVDFLLTDGQLTTEVVTTTFSDLAEEPLFDIDDERFETVIGGLVENLPELLGEDTAEPPAPGEALVNGAIEFDGPGRDFMSIYTDVQ